MQSHETNPTHSSNALMADDDCYCALASKDARFDGVFFTGVKTTGIYCRPICSVKTPKPSSCTFFSSAASAEAAGFRPCLRCRPELAPYALQQNLAHAIWQKIAAGGLNEQSLEKLSVQIGLSSRQVRRVLLQEFGVGPTEIAQTQRLLFAKKLLHETDMAMNEVAFAAGFGSVRRFNALFKESYQLTPNSIRRDANAKNKMNLSIQDQGICLRLSYRPPYAWAAMMQYLNGRAMPSLEYVNVHTQTYQRAVKYGDYEGWYQVSNSAAQSQLIVQLSSNLSPVLMPVLSLIRAQFDAEANPSIIASHLDSHYLLAKQLQKTPGLRVPGAFSIFELSIRTILGQQVSVAGATTVSGRLVRRFGTPCVTPWIEINHHFPSADTLASASLSDIAQLGMPGVRANTILQFAQFAAIGGLEQLMGKPLDQVVNQLKTLPGIGEWTAQYIAMRGYRIPNAFPAGDLGLQKAVSESEVRFTEKQLLAQSLAWSPWRSYAALLLWQSLSN
jgi:AraC family transcriptional regulator of adaptative response / DNA-3-methyladenine glycosylase II